MLVSLRSASSSSGVSLSRVQQEWILAVPRPAAVISRRPATSRCGFSPFGVQQQWVSSPRVHSSGFSPSRAQQQSFLAVPRPAAAVYRRPARRCGFSPFGVKQQWVAPPRRPALSSSDFSPSRVAAAVSRRPVSNRTQFFPAIPPRPAVVVSRRPAGRRPAVVVSRRLAFSSSSSGPRRLLSSSSGFSLSGARPAVHRRPFHPQVRSR